MRAIAIALVVLYHAGFPGVPGGYVGVDVFYVISGFLITRLLFDELKEGGKISFARFYGRRARRLLPSSSLVIAATLLASWLLFEPLRFIDVARDGLSAGAYVANFRFVNQSTDYFQAQRATSPFLHFWSLAVEEQFYLVWPALFVASAGRHANRARTACVLAVVCIGSLALSYEWTAHSPPRAFYLLPARAWELAIGGLLAVGLPWLERLPRRVGTGLGVIGIGAVAVAAAVFNDTTPFPGWRALLPVVGTAAVIAGGSAGVSGIGTLLRWTPMQWLGKRSYVLYLWHWPLLVLGVALLGHTLTLAEALALSGVAVVLAAVTHRVLEHPIHRSTWLASKTRRSLVLGLALTIATIGIAGVALAIAPRSDASAPVTGRPSISTSAELTETLRAATRAKTVPTNITPSIANAASDGTRPQHDGCHVPLEALTPKPGCIYGNAASPITVVLFGDSHADQWFPAIQAVAIRNGWRLVVVTKTACPAAELTVYNIVLNRSYAECDTWRRNALQFIEQQQPALVLMANANVYGLGDDDSHQGIERAWKKGYANTLKSLARMPGSTVLLAETPKPGSDVPVCISDHFGDVRDCVASRAAAVDEQFLALERSAADDTGADVINTTTWLCSDRGCPVIVGDLLVYHDTNHISSTYSKWLAPVLDEALRRVAPALLGGQPKPGG